MSKKAEHEVVQAELDAVKTDLDSLRKRLNQTVAASALLTRDQLGM